MSYNAFDTTIIYMHIGFWKFYIYDHDETIVAIDEIDFVKAGSLKIWCRNLIKVMGIK